MPLCSPVCMNSLGEVLIFLHDWCIMLLGSNLYPGVLTAVVQQVDLAVHAWVPASSLYTNFMVF